MNIQGSAAKLQEATLYTTCRMETAHPLCDNVKHYMRGFYKVSLFFFSVSIASKDHLLLNDHVQALAKLNSNQYFTVIHSKS